MPSYYYWADAVIGNLRIGSFEYIELEAVICKKPVVSFTNKSFKVILEGIELQSPFLPEDNDPKIIAKTIDNIVSSADFRETLYKKEYEFVKEITDPNKAAEWWDSLFEKSVKKYDSINRKSSITSVKLRMLLFLIANRLYYKKLKRLIIPYKHDM
jgi:glycosyltransferase involved in cell wall biosynthesis